MTDLLAPFDESLRDRLSNETGGSAYDLPSALSSDPETVSLSLFALATFSHC